MGHFKILKIKALSLVMKFKNNYNKEAKYKFLYKIKWVKIYFYQLLKYLKKISSENKCI